MEQWSLQEAKARFSELVNTCLVEGPQTVTRHGRPAVVVLSALDYERMVRPRSGLRDFFLSAPRVDLEAHRSRESGRTVDL